MEWRSRNTLIIITIIIIIIVVVVVVTRDLHIGSSQAFTCPVQGWLLAKVSQF